ncbi:putative baseplate assembly protein [Blastococcus sp. DSM 46786]|uniref:baseplate J/gp47 family protein n=1 Tax=Blastococcus sp. DSM 46786 TaxID=1798227 RepID=UPI0008D39128|nr:baseplate J/gp47 family protein [Blastococcus sp. DSM 46786]SEK59810.1 putative baseplate assembly protein [Blastococcus sp. DSM 46786]
MSRPPVHRPAPSPRDVAHPDPASARYFGPGFAELVQLAERLAGERHGIEIPAKGRGLARTLLEIPALLAHVLGEHQSLYAREAFLGTAESADSLWRHARTLGYTPDAGVAATGLAAVTVGAGLSGTIPQGFALQSSPRGEHRAQAYETLAATPVDAAFNAMRPADSSVPTPVVVAGGLVELPLTGRHGLRRGDVVLLSGSEKAGVFRVEDPLDGVRPPRVRLHRIDAGPLDETWPPPGDDGYRLHSRPQLRARVFGWNASASLYPPAALASPAGYSDPTEVGKVRHGYEVPPDPSGAAAALGTELFLAEAVDSPGRSGFGALVTGSGGAVVVLQQAVDRTVRFRRGECVELPGGEGTTTQQVVGSAFEGRVTALTLTDASGTARTWTSFPLDAVVLAGFDSSVDVVAAVPNPAPFDLTVGLAADLGRLRPGRPVILRRTDTDTGEARQAVVTALLPPAEERDPWQAVLSVPGTPLPPGWTKGGVEVLGNVVPVSHGETTRAGAHSSDGVTPHQSLELAKAPVTRVPAAGGVATALEVRVGGVRWDRVDDFSGVPSGARVYRTENGEDGAVTVHFGGEGRGAVPPAGSRNVTATYRVGLGAVGNLEAGRLTRVRRSSPLVASVTNPLPLSGGTDPASLADVARQATRPVRTLDRAVSVADHADLALLFPGVTRARARWLGGGAVELVVADAEGAAVPDPVTLRAFLDARRDTGTPLVILEPQAVPVVVVLRVERAPAWLGDAVRRAVEEALTGAGGGNTPPGMFTFAARQLSEPQSLAGLYARLLAVEGVSGAEATTFALRPPQGTTVEVLDVLHATDRQWLSLRPADLTVTVVEPGQLVPDVARSTGDDA